MWSTVKAMLRGKYVALNTYIRQVERGKISTLKFHLMKLQKEQIKAKESRSKEIKISADIHETENRKSMKKIKKKTKRWFFINIKKIDEPLASLIKKEKEKKQMTNSRNERVTITTDPMHTDRKIKEHYE